MKNVLKLVAASIIVLAIQTTASANIKACVDLIADRPSDYAPMRVQSAAKTALQAKVDFITLAPEFFGLSGQSPADIRLAVDMAYRTNQPNQVAARVLEIINDVRHEKLFSSLGLLKEIYTAMAKSHGGNIVNDFRSNIVFDDINTLLGYYIQLREIRSDKLQAVNEFIEKNGKSILSTEALAFAREIRQNQILVHAKAPLVMDKIDSLQTDTITIGSSDTYALIWTAKTVLAQKYPRTSATFKLSSMGSALETHVKIRFVSEGFKTPKEIAPFLPKGVKPGSENKFWYSIYEVQLIVGPLNNPTSVSTMTVPLTSYNNQILISQANGLKIAQTSDGQMSLRLDVTVQYASNMTPYMRHTYPLVVEVP